MSIKTIGVRALLTTKRTQSRFYFLSWNILL